MNLFHSRQYEKIIKTYVLEKFNLTFGNSILDIGCGGGKAVNLFFELLSNSMICGIDPSSDMVKLASTVNKSGIIRGIVEIKQAEAARIPYPDEYFNVITAFDTINLWDDYQNSLKEIYRVLKKYGLFFIVNAYPIEGPSWYDFVKFKDDKAYINLLESSGFADVKVDNIKNTIIIYGKK
jgi:ubiquinone/menaquinone biosynthesis C-methylase UbiE